MTPAARPQTIQIFLPLGDPRGIRIAEITTRIVQLIEVPRPQLDVFLAMPESEQVAVYFLFGQTGDLRKRLASHNKDKDFWQRALVLISRTASLTQTHGLFLEWQYIQAARQAGRYVTENGNAGTRPHTPAPAATPAANTPQRVWSCSRARRAARRSPRPSPSAARCSTPARCGPASTRST